MFILTGAQVMDGNPHVWVEGAYNTQREAYEAQYFANDRYEEDYGETAEDAGVEWEVHRVDGRIEE